MRAPILARFSNQFMRDKVFCFLKIHVQRIFTMSRFALEVVTGALALSVASSNISVDGAAANAESLDNTHTHDVIVVGAGLSGLTT